MDKFNDYDKLLESYNQLEKEFTKKCQQLSELKKESGTSEQSSPLSSEEFFAKYPDAENFKEEIFAQASSPEYADDVGAYEKAYFALLRKNYVSPDKLAGDEDFLQRYVLSNDQVVQRVLQKAVGQRDDAPTVISGKGGSMSVALPTKPRTIKEASQLATEYFK